MMLLDTNVVSELVRTEPQESVGSWFLEARAGGPIGITSMTLAELHEGIARQPNGARKRYLSHSLFHGFLNTLRPDVVGFTEHDAERYGEIHQIARSRGEQLSVADAIIAAVTLTQHATLATGDRQLLRLPHLPTVNPWDHAGY